VIIVEVTDDKVVIRRAGCPDEPDATLVLFNNHLTHGSTPPGVPVEVQAAAVQAAAHLEAVIGWQSSGPRIPAGKPQESPPGSV
jgi:hypothetical protein